METKFRYLVTKKQITSARPDFEKIASFSEVDICKLWNGGIVLSQDELEKLEYQYNVPLYQKMIWRFGSCEYSPSRFYIQIDPCNRQRLRHYFRVFDDHFDALLEFTAWIKNFLAAFDIEDLAKQYQLSVDEYQTLWEQNEIKFLYALPDKAQDDLILRYNYLFDS